MPSLPKAAQLRIYFSVGGKSVVLHLHEWPILGPNTDKEIERKI